MTITLPTQSDLPSVVHNIDTKLSSIRDARRAIEAEYARVLAGYADAESRLTEARLVLTRDTKMTSNGGHPPRLSVSPEKLRLVHNYLLERREATQVAIGKDLNLNSGSVSVALAILANDGKIQDADPAEGERSRRWHIKTPPREIVVRPGEGVTPGRLVAAS